MKEPTFHPVAEMFPLLEGEDFAELVENIRENGQIDPILRHKGQIVDGRNRFLACKKLGIRPRYEEWDGKGSLVAISASRNLHRRHLTPGQRAAAGVEVEEGLSVEAKANLKTGGKNHAKPAEVVHSRDRAARICRVSSRYIGEAKLIRDHDRKLFEQVRDGKIKLSVAKRAVHRAAKAKQHLKAVLPPLDESACKMIHGDCIEQLELLPTNSVDLIFADPPYNIGVDYGKGPQADLLPLHKFNEWCERWIDECARVLKPKGSIFVMIDSGNTDDTGILLAAAELHQRNIIIWHETFGSYTDDNFTSCARFIHYYTKGKSLFTFDGDAVRIQSDRQKQGDKRANPTGKVPGNVWEFPRLVDNAAERVPGFPTQIPIALVERIVKAASEPGDLVVDPFNGSGTTAAACIRHGRRFVGFDTNAKYVASAKQRAASEFVARKADGK